jgi:hypothetical protein
MHSADLPIYRSKPKDKKEQDAGVKKNIFKGSVLNAEIVVHIAY